MDVEKKGYWIIYRENVRLIEYNKRNAINHGFWKKHKAIGHLRNQIINTIPKQIEDRLSYFLEDYIYTISYKIRMNNTYIRIMVSIGRNKSILMIDLKKMTIKFKDTLTKIDVDFSFVYEQISKWRLTDKPTIYENILEITKLIPPILNIILEYKGDILIH
jgi:hypothetical protein